MGVGAGVGVEASLGFPMITDILNKTGQQYKVIEYPLIILFVRVRTR